MSDALERMRTRLAELERAFDQAFTEPAQVREADPEDLLAIEVAGHAYALRARELLGLYVDRSITTLPAAPPELLGLAAVRGELVAVYDLATLLGYGHVETPHYLALSRGPSIAFAFAKLTGHTRVAKHAIAPSQRAGETWLSEVVRETDQTRPIVELSGICAAIEQRMRFEGRKENDSHG
jgi:chemotaxis signal transduction protein